jgi:serine/threonine protein kinase/tetratricopeptide (TPR) repeat protein
MLGPANSHYLSDKPPMSYTDYEHDVADITLLEEPSPGAAEPRFTRIRRIGSGSTATVYQVFDHALQSVVALKVLNPPLQLSDNAVEDIRREVQLARRVRDAHVVRVFDLHSMAMRWMVSMEYIDGPDLAHILKETRVLTPTETIRLAKDVSLGLSGAHDSGIIHRDVKPSNILIASDRCVLTDLGLASATQDMALRSSRQTGALLYRSPESMKGAEPTATSDFYSLGVVLFEMLTGQRAVSDDRLPSEALASLGAVRTVSPRDYNSEIPDWLSDIILHCLEADPTQRYQTAKELLRDLDRESYLCASPQLDKTHQTDNGRRDPGTPATTSPSTKLEPHPTKAQAKRHSALDGRSATAGIATLGLALLIATAFMLNRFLTSPNKTEGRTERSIAVMQFDMTAVPGSTEATLRSLEANLYVRLGEALPEAALWHCDWTSRVNPRSKILARAEIVIDGEFAYDNARLTATAIIHSRTWPRRTSSVRVVGTSRDLLQFEDQLLTALTSNPSIRHMIHNVRTSPDITSDPDAYSAFCTAKSALRDGATVPEQLSAIRCLDKATARDPNFASAFAAKAELDLQAYQANHDPKLLADAWAASERAARLSPNSVSTKVATAYAYLVSNQRDRAIELLDDQSFLQSANVQRILGDTLRLDKAASQGAKAIRRSIALNPLSASSYLALGDCYTELGDYASAAGAYRNALDLDENDDTALNNLGESYIRTARFVEAIPVLQASLRLHSDATSYANLGFAYLYAQQAALAVPLFEKAAALDSNTDEYLGALGQMYSLLGDPRSTLTLERARSIARLKYAADRSDGKVLSRLALYDARLGRALTAEQESLAAMRTAPTNLDVRYDYALVQLLGHKMPDALQTLRTLGEGGFTSPFDLYNPDRKLLESLPGFAALRARYGSSK